MGIRGKINLGFGFIALLLLFSGVVSFVEMGSLGKQTSDLLDQNSRSIELSRRMLDAVQLQNSAVLHALVNGNNEPDYRMAAGQENFESALAEVTAIAAVPGILDSLYSARSAYGKVLEEYFDGHEFRNSSEFIESYSNVYNRFNGAIKEFMIISQAQESEQASLLESNAYRALIPGIISLLASIIIISLFAFFIDLYYTRPLLSLNRATGEFLKHRRPFSVKTEGRDEMHSLAGRVEDIADIARRKNRE